jgi:hypothetical protein
LRWLIRRSPLVLDRGARWLSFWLDKGDRWPENQGLLVVVVDQTKVVWILPQHLADHEIIGEELDLDLSAISNQGLN